MDNHGKRVFNEDKDSTKIFDLSESMVEDEYSGEEDIDTLYEENESDNIDGDLDHTKVMERVKDTGEPQPAKKRRKTDDPDREKRRQEQLKKKNSKRLEKLMKKQRRREKHSEREVLSFEDMPLEERENVKKKKTRRFLRKRVIAAALIVVILFGVVFVATNNDRFSWHNVKNFIKYAILNQDSDQHFPVSVQGETVEIGNFLRMGQDICCASDTKIQIINNYGRFEYTTQHGLTNPVLTVSKRYAMLYSLGGHGYQINDYENTVYTSETDDVIIAGDITDKGVYALVTTSDGYLSKLRVYDKDNKRIFSYSFADYSVTSVSVSPKGRFAVVTGISALNGEEISSIYVLDFTKDKPVYLEEVDNNIFYDIQYLNDTYACAIGNSVACVINTRTGDVKTTDYEGRSLTCYTINSDTNSFSISLSRSGDGRNCEIISVNNNGKKTVSFETEYQVKHISTYKGRISLLTHDTIYLYNKTGKKISSKSVSNEPKAAVLYTTVDAYVLDTNEINAMRL